MTELRTLGEIWAEMDKGRRMALLGAGPPIRYMAGIDPEDIRLDPNDIWYIDRDEPLLQFRQTPQQKETIMPIDKKKFYGWTDRLDAEDLGQKNIGDLVTVTTVDGVKIADVLTGLAAGSPWGSGDSRFTDKVYVTLEHVGSAYQPYDGRGTGVFLEPRSRVSIKPHKLTEDE